MPTAHKYVFLQKTELKDAKKAVEELILSRHCNPIVVRLACLVHHLHRVRFVPQAPFLACSNLVRGCLFCQSCLLSSI